MKPDPIPAFLVCLVVGVFLILLFVSMPTQSLESAVIEHQAKQQNRSYSHPVAPVQN